MHYQPPWWGRNAHVQSLLATFKLRRSFVEKRARALLEVSNEVILDCQDEKGDAVKLQGYYSPSLTSKEKGVDKGLVILIHGWEGSAASMYLLSAAQSLFAEGYAVFRLNLRDHGTSHHLNQDLFHSCRLQEVVSAVAKIRAKYQPSKLFMAGFSLGGNFCLRVAAEATKNNIPLDKVVAICPPIDPYDTMIQLRNGPWIYDWYFKRKWKRSLRKKAELFPDYLPRETFESIDDMGELTNVLIKYFGEYHDARTYFDSYALKGERLAHLDVPSTMLLAKDDPICRHQGSELINANNKLKIVKTEYGGHCGHLKNGRLHSWADDFIINELASV